MHRRRMQLLEDTTGSRVALHYLRDRDGNELYFLSMIDGRPVLLAEVKTGDDTFAKAFWRFGRYFPTTRKVQVVLDLKKPKEKEGISMVPAHEFLAGLNLAYTYINLRK